MREIELSPLELDPRSGLFREPPRAKEQRPSGYEEEFDQRTILYDLFWSADGRDVIGVGPPLANLAATVLPLLRRVLCRPILSRFRHRTLDRCDELWLRRPRERLALPPGVFTQAGLKIQPNCHDMFPGKKVALTKSRNNALPWIRDWSYFLAKAHGCNAILLYDNASTNASAQEIHRTIAAVPGIETAVVVSWPFKFGPQGGPHAIWDSDYCQYGILEHARFRFLPTAQAVIRGDVDEFIITEDGVSLFDLAAQAGTGYIRYGGRWVDTATDVPPDPAHRRHKDYRYYDAKYDGNPVREKWTVVPSKCPRRAQWCVHDVLKVEPDPTASAQASLRHFRAINTNWISTRWREAAVDPDRHHVDAELVRWLRIFDDAPAVAGETEEMLTR
jgi:hypothetical protein